MVIANSPRNGIFSCAKGVRPFKIKVTNLDIKIFSGSSRRFGRSQRFAGRRRSGQTGRFRYGQENVLRRKLREERKGK